MAEQLPRRAAVTPAADGQITELEGQIETLKGSLLRYDQQVQQQEAAREQSEKARRLAEQERLKHEAELERVETERNRASFLLRLLVGALIGLMGMVAASAVMFFVSWSWLSNHPNRLGLYGCTMTILAAVVWAIADRKRRTYALGAIALGAFLVLLQIIGK